MNFSDLFIVIALASGLYGLVVAVTGQRHFLTRAVNPHRATWLIAAFCIAWVGIGILRWEAKSSDPATWKPLLEQLITDAPTSPRVKVASLAIFLGIVFIVLVAWCQFMLPRDPSAFRRPKDRKAALRYYVTRLRGGLDFALLACGDCEPLEEAANVKQIQMRCPHLPKVQMAETEPPRMRTVEDQLECWRKIARLIHQRRGELDGLIEPAFQGSNRRLILDAEYGGIFFKYLRPPDPRSKLDSGQFLFGATLNQAEMDSRRAEQHFDLLVEALQHIDRSIRMD